MLELVLRPMADAFMQVGVFVALLVLPFGWARLRWGHRFEEALERHRRLGPLLAALLTVPPGCGGAIVVVGAYSRGAVTYGAAVSALVATSGDAAWVLLAADPVLALQLKVLLVVTGTATGLVVDAVGLSPALRRDRLAARAPVLAAVGAGARTGGVPGDALATAVTGSPVGTPEVGPPVAGNGPGGPLGRFALVLWMVLGAGLLVSLPVTFRLVDTTTVVPADPYLVLGGLGAALCLVGFVLGRGRLADDEEADAHPASMTEVLRHGAHEVAFLTTWVAAAYLGWEALSASSGLDVTALPLVGLAGVLVGALVGLLPGCALQIVFTGVFVAGGMPLPTLVANSISQDGDALIPLLALERRPALLATVLTTVPALLVGGALHLLA